MWRVGSSPQYGGARLPVSASRPCGCRERTGRQAVVERGRRSDGVSGVRWLGWSTASTKATSCLPAAALEEEKMLLQ